MAISDVVSAIKYAINSTIGTSDFKSIDVMLNDLKTAINTSVSSQISALNTKITAVETTANNANTAAASANANKMDKTNPTGTGTFSIDRVAGSEAGPKSIAFYGTASSNNAIAMGTSTKAIGINSLALVPSATANNANCVAIGMNTTAGNTSSNITTETRAIAIGYGATAPGTYHIAIGSSANSGPSSISGNIAIGVNSATSYGDTANVPSVAIGYTTHVYGSGTVAIGCNVQMGSSNLTKVPNSVAIGLNISTKGLGVIAIGDGPTTGANSLSPNYAIAIGKSAVATTNSSIALGYNTSAGATDGSSSGFTACTAIGAGTSANGKMNTAIGQGCKALGTKNVALGSNVSAGGTLTEHGLAIGSDVSTSSSQAIVIGNESTSGFAAGCVIGTRLTGRSGYSITMGYYNSTETNYRFAIGNGASYSALSNVFRVTDSGVYAKGNYNASGADYAEMFEWADGNPNNEDRVGLFVKLDGEGISISENGDDFILGIVSAAPSICGDTASEDWQGRFEHDIFGRLLFEEIEVPEKTQEVTDPETGETKTEIVSPKHTRTWYKQNPDWNPEEEYIPRESRQEWDPVGLIGKLVMIDDGTAEVNGYVKPSKGGIATKSEKHTRFRVMKRIDDTHIRVLMLTYEPRV